MSRRKDPFVEMDELTISNNVVFSQDRSIRAFERLHCMAPSPRRGSPQASGSRCPSESSSRIRHLHGRPTILATSRVLRWAPSSGSPIPIRRVHQTTCLRGSLSNPDNVTYVAKKRVNVTYRPGRNLPLFVFLCLSYYTLVLIDLVRQIY
jgi:hypothetical protein